MKRLMMLTMLASVSAAGCVVEVSDDPDARRQVTPDAGPPAPDAIPAPDAEVPFNGILDVTWAPDPACPAVDSVVEVIAVERTTEVRNVDIYPCSALGATIEDYPAGTYDVWVEVTDAAGVTLLAQSTSLEAVVTTHDVAVLLDIPTVLINDGYMTVTWNFVDSVGGVLTCADVFSASVDVLATVAGTTEATSDVWNCVDGVGTTSPLPIDDYTVVVEVLNEADEALEVSASKPVSIEFGNQFVDLGNYTFEF